VTTSQPGVADGHAGQAVFLTLGGAVLALGITALLCFPLLDWTAILQSKRYRISRRGVSRFVARSQRVRKEGRFLWAVASSPPTKTLFPCLRSRGAFI